MKTDEKWALLIPIDNYFSISCWSQAHKLKQNVKQISLEGKP